ncbi:hypothetical protein DFH27DRAFT_651486 [Peziza echinospora]|nr:hypothetical protein DFH27DRAFT_651486 [Peziza echinospora]
MNNLVNQTREAGCRQDDVGNGDGGNDDDAVVVMGRQRSQPSSSGLRAGEGGGGGAATAAATAAAASVASWRGLVLLGSADKDHWLQQAEAHWARKGRAQERQHPEAEPGTGTEPSERTHARTHARTNARTHAETVVDCYRSEAGYRGLACPVDDMGGRGTDLVTRVQVFSDRCLRGEGKGWSLDRESWPARYKGTERLQADSNWGQEKLEEEEGREGRGSAADVASGALEPAGYYLFARLDSAGNTGSLQLEAVRPRPKPRRETPRKSYQTLPDPLVIEDSCGGLEDINADGDDDDDDEQYWKSNSVPALRQF